MQQHRPPEGDRARAVGADQAIGADEHLAQEVLARQARAAGVRRTRQHVERGAPDGSSARKPAPACSRPRSALLSAAPKVRSMAITSPVAFIWEPSERSAVGNLSNGKRGSLTTT